MMEKFFTMLYRLRLIKRWGTSYCNVTETVSEHSYYVTIIAGILYEIDLQHKKINENNINLTDLLVYGLYHDSFECYSAHTISPVKKISKDTNDVFSDVNSIYKNRLASLLPENGYSDIKKAFNNVDSRVINYIEMADAIEAYVYAAFEVHTGNNDFLNKKILMKEKVDQLATEYDCVKFFLLEFIDDHFEINY